MSLISTRLAQIFPELTALRSRLPDASRAAILIVSRRARSSIVRVRNTRLPGSSSKGRSMPGGTTALATKRPS